MSNVTISPNMGLPVPNVAVDPGPDWANNINASLSILDGHSHVAGSGVQITPAAININADLTFNQTNNLISVRSVRFQPLLSAIAGVSPDLGCLYESGVDLYYNDGAGNQIRITQSGSVAGASGTITGLPSGTASASYSSINGTFTWQQATNTGANMDSATLIIRYPGSYPTPTGNYISLQAPSSLSTGFAFTLPNNTPGVSQSALVSDTSGNLSYLNPDGIAAAMTSTGANTIANNQTRTVNNPAPIGGVAISASCGNFTTTSNSYVDVTNLNITITTSGRPIFVGLQGDTSGGAFGSQWNGSSSAGGLTKGIRVLNVTTSTVAGFYVNNISSFASLPSVLCLDPQPAGTYNYKVQVSWIGGVTGTISMTYTQLVAYEL